RGPIEREQPENVDAEVLQVVELARQSLEIADAVVVRVEERLDVRLVDDAVFVPEIVHSKGPACRVLRPASPANRTQGTGRRMQDFKESIRNHARSSPFGECGKCAPAPRSG